MLVRELIDLLSKMDPDAEIRATSAGWDSELPGVPEVREVRFLGGKHYLEIGAE